MSRLDNGNTDAFSFLCQLCDPSEGKLSTVHDVAEIRKDRSDRKLTFRVDSGATVTVVPRKHKAARGYKTWRDRKYGYFYGTAAKGKKVMDEGLRVLKTKAGQDPQESFLLKTRCVDVENPLLSVIDLLKSGHAVMFDENRSFAIHKKLDVNTYSISMVVVGT